MFDRSVADECLALAAQSDCELMKFGAMLIRDNQIIGRGYNKKIHPCVSRFQCCEYRRTIRPRGQAELCEAVHAEQRAIHDAVQNGFSPSGSSLVVCGRGPGGEVWIREGAYFSCTVCSRFLFLFGIKEVIVQVKSDHPEGWDFAILTMEEALLTSYEIAFGEREVKRVR